MTKQTNNHIISRLTAVILALALCLGSLPTAAFAASLPDWYFLFAIFKNVDADGKDRNGKDTHVKYSMSQAEINLVKENAKAFEEYINSLGIMRAHVDVVEIDATVTELSEYSGGSYLDTTRAAPLLEGKADLDKYDHVTCAVSLNDLDAGFVGLTGGTFENGTGQSCINLKNEKYALDLFAAREGRWPPSAYVHEFLHSMEGLNRKWGTEFNLHLIEEKFYAQNNENYSWKTCYTDVLLNRVKGDDETGTGVDPVAWQYPPHALRTMTEFTIPAGATGIGDSAFNGCGNLQSVTIPASVTSIGAFAFNNCSSLKSVKIPASVTSIGKAAFCGCSNLQSVTIPAGITRVEDYTFANCFNLTDVYYGGSEAQWKAVQIGSISNTALGRVTIHYNSVIEEPKTAKPAQSVQPAQPAKPAQPVKFTDVPAGAYYYDPVQWAVAQGIASGIGSTTFGPELTCTQGQILTFLWRAKGSPAPAGAVSGKEYYAKAMQWAKEQEIINSALKPSNPCTRVNVVTYLWKLAGSPDAKAASFSDIGPWNINAKAINWAVEQGITAGTGATTFSPDQTCTRGQIVTFLYRAFAK